MPRHSKDAAPSSTTPAVLRRPRTLLLRGAALVIGLQLVIAMLTRLALLVQGRAELDWSRQLGATFAAGLWFDLLAGLYAAAVWWLVVFLAPAALWRSRAGRMLLAAGFALWGLVFGFIAIAEWFFWDEFQVRFNFIAVDYLMFTQEVLDNIWQSYPMPVIFSGLLLAALSTGWLVWRLGLARWVAAGDARWLPRLWQTASFGALITGLSFGCSQSQLPRFANEFNRELAKNGIYAFCAAFWESEIDYERFYLKQPLDECLMRARELLASEAAEPASADPHDLRRVIKCAAPERRWNVVLVSIESLSAEFLHHHHKSSNLTPVFDRLIDEGLWFSRMYATGTRTVRGLEALTLSVPPTPGQSILWRPKSDHLFSLGGLFQERGYDTSFVYGGDAMFDNMNRFFSTNGYRVVDRQAKTAADITFQNAWGVSDEDLFRWAVTEADNCHGRGTPFFMHVMTVSNHRPYTFPAGVPGVPASGGGRPAGVRYTDHAIGQFIEQAKTKPWFASTLFVFVADHCHGSAGKAELDVTKYHIPCVIWNPLLVQPQVFKPMVSQIDVAPTVLGLLHWSYVTRFYGEDVLGAGYGKPDRRAFISNYQKIALLREDSIGILKPKQEVTLGTVDLKTGLISAGDDEGLRTTLDDAVAFYQSAAWQFQNGHLGKNAKMP